MSKKTKPLTSHGDIWLWKLCVARTGSHRTKGMVFGVQGHHRHKLTALPAVPLALFFLAASKAVPGISPTLSSLL
jgi:hypothetical protein